MAQEAILEPILQSSLRACPSKDEPIPVDPSITMGMMLVLLGRYRKVLLAVREYSCAPKVTELVSA